MILAVTEVDTIRHIQKAQTAYMTEFESVFDKVERKEKERKERAKNEQKAKEIILHKRRMEKRKAEADKQAKEAKRRAEEDRKRREAEQHTTTEELPSRLNDRGSGSEHAQGSETPRTDQDIQSNGHELNNASSGSTQESASVIGSTWSEVSPEQASQYMAQGTGVSADVWAGVIYRESSNNPTIVNEIGCFGYLQLHPVHGASSTWTPQQYLDKAIEIYNTAGAGSWEAW